MGSSAAATANTCSTIALRYRFVVDTLNGHPSVQFLAHQVLKCETAPTTPATDDLHPDRVHYDDDVHYLRSLDPKEWKKQDHYRVLGIRTLRHRATDDIIKTAYRKMVLKHHPDKRKALGEEIRPDDDYFTCITMAYETLGNPLRRRAYDSVDPEFDNLLPGGAELKEDFFAVFPYYFEINARWSERAHVPKIGSITATRPEVEHFYAFWYDFKSWREYSYEDEEDKDKCADRDERRFCEKLNKVERLRKKKEEMVRIRSLVDLAYGCDPRIARFKQEDRERKLAAKRARLDAVQAKREEEERERRAQLRAREEADAAHKAQMEAKRQERDAQKRALKKERKVFRDLCKANNYFASDPNESLAHIQALDTICERFTHAQLEQLNGQLASDGRETFVRAMHECEARVAAEKRAALAALSTKTSNNHIKGVVGAKPGAQLASQPGAKVLWSPDHVQLLIKAVNLFPAGTGQRWEVVANFLNQHGQLGSGEEGRFNAKDVLAKAKDLQSADFSKSDLKEAANRQAFTNFEREKRGLKVVDEAEISRAEREREGAWTTAEQQLLEQALKTYPAATVERWERIAECVPQRTKKECMRRYKELVEIVKAKKAAQALDK